MARYNQWANRDLFAAVRALPKSEVAKHRRSLFKNILNTLNHPLVADRMWWAHMHSNSIFSPGRCCGAYMTAISSTPSATCVIRLSGTSTCARSARSGADRRIHLSSQGSHRLSSPPNASIAR
jgi:hypothetical protein